jgi:hypothetical protein
MSRQTEEQNWPALPAAPERPAVAAAPPAHDATGDNQEACDASGRQASARQPRWPQTDPVMPTRADVLAPVIDLACVRGGGAGSKREEGFWSQAAWEALEGAGRAGTGVLVALERQMGGVAQDPRFSREISWVDAQVQEHVGGGDSGGRLEALGFLVVKIVALFREDLELQFVELVQSCARLSRGSQGWRVCQVPEGERNGGQFYAWNSETGDSCWSLPHALDLLHEGREAGNWGDDRMVGGWRASLTWAPLGPEAARLAAQVGGGGRKHEAALLDALAAKHRNAAASLSPQDLECGGRGGGEGGGEGGGAGSASGTHAFDGCDLERALVQAARDLGFRAPRRARARVDAGEDQDLEDQGEEGGGEEAEEAEEGLVQDVEDIPAGQVLQVLPSSSLFLPLPKP